MDFTFFGLTRRPFRPTPDSELYFPAVAHETAVVALTEAYEDSDGIALIDGEPGTGKTLAVLRFLASLPARVATVLIPVPRFTRPTDLFQAILFDFGVPYQGLSEQELRLTVADRLLGGLANGDGPTVVVIDEAQHLGPDILEEIRLLGNLESRSAKAAFVVLAGLPVVRAQIGKPELAGLSQRVAVRSRIGPLSADESVGFIRHQIEVCGGVPANMISDEALVLLAEHGRGVPRLLNQAAAASFGLAAAAGEQMVDAEPVLEALGRLGLVEEGTAEVAVIPHPAKVAETEIAPSQPRAAKPKGRKRRSA